MGVLKRAGGLGNFSKISWQELAIRHLRVGSLQWCNKRANISLHIYVLLNIITYVVMEFQRR